MSGPLTVDIVATDRVMWSGTAQRIVAPAVDGEIGLLRNHEPLLALLKAGTVRVHGEDGEDLDFPIGGGFLSFDHNIVTVVVDADVNYEE